MAKEKRGKEDLQNKKDTVLYMDCIWNTDSNKPTGEGELFEKNQGNWTLTGYLTIVINNNNDYYLVVITVLW